MKEFYRDILTGNLIKFIFDADGNIVDMFILERVHEVGSENLEKVPVVKTAKPKASKAVTKTPEKKVYSCKNCGAPGHTSRSCPQNTKPARPLSMDDGEEEIEKVDKETYTHVRELMEELGVSSEVASEANLTLAQVNSILSSNSFYAYKNQS